MKHGGTIAGWLSHLADLERVSIDAFQILAGELVHHGAPVDLVTRARLAEADEVQHARIFAELARREGAAISQREVPRGPVRAALVDIALENAVEGCIRETYSALVAGYQAEHAGRREIRRLMKRIYREETSHAELAWDVHQWLMQQLTAKERHDVERAMRVAIAELALAARSPIASDLVDALGLPPRERASRLVAGLAAQLFTPAIAWGSVQPLAS